MITIEISNDYSRWLNINEINAAFTISLTLFSDHLKWNSCQTSLSLKLYGIYGINNHDLFRLAFYVKPNHESHVFPETKVVFLFPRTGLSSNISFSLVILVALQLF